MSSKLQEIERLGGKSIKERLKRTLIESCGSECFAVDRPEHSFLSRTIEKISIIQKGMCPGRTQGHKRRVNLADYNWRTSGVHRISACALSTYVRSPYYRDRNTLTSTECAGHRSPARRPWRWVIVFIGILVFIGALTLLKHTSEFDQMLRVGGTHTCWAFIAVQCKNRY